VPPSWEASSEQAKTHICFQMGVFPASLFCLVLLL
jgi:hypothetical protein